MAVSQFVKIRPLLCRRRPSSVPDISRLWRRHAHQAGEVITAWNDLQASLFGIFAVLLDKNGKLALAIWHTVQSDAVQRQFLIAAANAQLIGKDSVQVLRRIQWLKDTIDKFAHLRNDPAHTPIAFATFGGEPFLIPDWFSGKPPAVNRLHTKPLNTTWRTVRGDLFALSAYALSIRIHISTNGSMPIPHRPRLLSLPKPNPRKSQRRRARGKPPASA